MGPDPNRRREEYPRIVFMGTPTFASIILEGLFEDGWNVVGAVTQPDRPRGFRVPLVPWLPLTAMAACIFLAAGLPLVTWLRFAIWLVVGMAIYFSYGRSRSTLGRGQKIT